MKVTLSVHGSNAGSRARLREIVHELARPIERRLGALQPDTARIEAHIDKNPAHHLYRVSARLKVPRRVLATAAEDHDLSAVLVAVFEDLERRTERYLARLRGAHQRRRAPIRRRREQRDRAHAMHA